MDKVVVDTSIIIDGEITKLIESGNLKDCEIIIPVAVLDELQSQASQSKDYGFVGLEEIKKIRELAQKSGITLRFEGQRPSMEDIKLARHGRIDAIIKDIAKKNDAMFYTADYVQALVAQAEGIKTKYSKPEIKVTDLEFEKFFDNQTMSVHLKEGTPPVAKRGKPGAFLLVQLDGKILTKEYLEGITTQILEVSRVTRSGVVEISKPGALVVQFRDFRVVITHPPFSDSYEITITHPIVKLSLEQYRISEKLMQKFSDKAEGVLIAGAPGSGKSTLASSLAEFYSKRGKIVKTFESPRDLQVDEKTTQYTQLDGSFENAADILLLVRPDYTIYDEIRRFHDFRVFSDLRLAGVGMVGVVHANAPLDAIQRFIGKVDLGMIPHILDTVVFVEGGEISKVYELEFKVKVPTGMTEQDLARPVIEVRNFENHSLEYEIYTYGEENIVIPISKEAKSGGIERLAESKIRDTIRRFDSKAEIEILSNNSIRVRVDKESIPALIGRGGSTINELEKSLGVHIDVEEKDQASTSERFEMSESGNNLIFEVDNAKTGMDADIYVNDRHILSTRVGKRGKIIIAKRSGSGKRIVNAVMSKNDIKLVVHD
ncbi:MAG: ATPase [Thaumarchaeota archaeon 13_1_40CM_38_12]|nr:MAG: ATPase [Thaumarchaeota archaeon 13_1_40CM_38_12]OLC34944.1 MAG: ATPase [Thaumarchaeota archaeon 13_1_40CM_4_38_7]OLC94510.1 MAG: ATPase [Thaumarchaeota archaeon 13_1_40CM_3_38_6]OLD27621.1 MAG: ATPase [Thaumarchaeota archaeon 13_1_40CM_2_39_7]TLY03567.1 MAG: ATPase [Nitrososphaerota archaeon]